MLSAAGRTYIRLAPSNTTVVEGSKVSLSCRAESALNNISYQWFRGDVNVQLVNDHDQHDDDDDVKTGGGLSLQTPNAEQEEIVEEDKRWEGS